MFLIHLQETNPHFYFNIFKIHNFLYQTFQFNLFLINMQYKKYNPKSCVHIKYGDYILF